MCLKKTLLTTLCILAALAVSSPAQTSEWGGMSFVGDHNGWDARPNMGLTSNNFWEGDFYIFYSPTNRFKFVADWGWNVSEWGIDPTNQLNKEVPVDDFAVIFTNGGGWGMDIRITNYVSGIYHVTFDDQTDRFTVALVQEVFAKYSSMGVAGEMNAWSTTPNMTLVSNNVWMADLYVPAASQSRFKLVAENSWGLSFGEINQSDFSVPMTATAEGPGGSIYDISMHNVGSGLYRFWFNDTSLVYSVSYLRAGVANYSSMAVAGSFNGWNPLPNMQLIEDHVWQAPITFVNQGRITFKFAANGGWNTSWGISNQALVEWPIMGTADPINTNGFDLALNGPLNGRYYFRFNDSTRYFEVFPEGSVETFNNWSRLLAYGYYTNNGWVIANGLVNDIKSRYGYCVRLRESPSSGQYLRTPLLTNGVLRYSFWYRNWDDVEPITETDYQLQTSTNGTDWVTNDLLYNITTTNYARYSKELNETNAIYIRLLHVAGGERLLIDDFVIVEPLADVDVADVGTSPINPWIQDSVYITGLVITNQFATNLTVTAYYRINSTGVWASLSTSGLTNRYTTTTAIPAQAPGTIVYYYIKADFLGRGTKSPVYWPDGGTNDPLWYGIAHNRRGSVWINEVNYNPGFWDAGNTNEFIELAGLSGADIGDWTVELLDGYIPYAAYVITNNTLLANDWQGFGFFVIGDEGVPDVRMLFTNTVYGDSSLTKNGAIRLKNEYGVTDFTLTYGQFPPTNLPGSQYIGFDDDFVDYDLSLSVSGTGSNYIELTWSTNYPTPGEVNYNETFTSGNMGPLPSLNEADIVHTLMRGTMTIRVASTNGWNAVPYFAASVSNHWPDQWTAIDPYVTRYEGGTNFVTFDIPSNAAMYFRTKSTRTW